MIVGVWPHNETRGEIVAITYGEKWLVLHRGRKDIWVYETYQDPNKIHRHYSNNVFWEDGTYMSPRDDKDKKGNCVGPPKGTYEYNGKTFEICRNKDMSHQGRFIGKVAMEDNLDWYRMIEDPETYIRLALL